MKHGSGQDPQGSPRRSPDRARADDGANVADRAAAARQPEPLVDALLADAPLDGALLDDALLGDDGPIAAPDAVTLAIDPALLDELGLARLAAHRAAAEIADRWHTGARVRFKGPIDPVTEADLAAERVILDLIRARFPDDWILAEEEGASGSADSGRRWLVDPLDGTTNFSHRFPHFCVSIASADAQGPRVGVIVEPLRGWTFEAVRGAGAWLDGRRIGVSETHRLDRALVATGFPYDRHTARDNNSAHFAHALRCTQGMRRAGSAALDLAFVAAGWLDGYWEFRLNPWDLAAGALLVQEAGGRVSTPTGGPWYLHGPDIVASNGPLHGQLLALLADTPPDPEDARP